MTMTLREYESKLSEIATINRRLGQLYRRVAWNYHKIVALEARRGQLQSEIRFHGSVIAELRECERSIWERYKTS